MFRVTDGWAGTFEAHQAATLLGVSLARQGPQTNRWSHRRPSTDGVHVDTAALEACCGKLTQLRQARRRTKALALGTLVGRHSWMGFTTVAICTGVRADNN